MATAGRTASGRGRPRRLALRAAACAAAALSICALLPAQVSTGRYLYTEPDPSAGGGIRGGVAHPEKPLRAALAVSADDPRKVYLGTVTGKDRRAFVFKGLPVDRYDLVLVFENVFYEGLTLLRGKSDLTSGDREAIETAVRASEPFFNRKVIHRLAGRTGRLTGSARCVCTFVRTRSALGFLDGKRYPGHRRAFKTVSIENVGPGWQVARTRELYTVQADPGGGEDEPAHVFDPALGGIRVTDNVKDLGAMRLAPADK